MKRSDASKLAREHMDKHGLQNVRMVINPRLTSTFGKYRYSRLTASDKRIELSGPLVDLNDEARVLRTILHEIAHALTEGHGHDDVWRAKCLAIGGDGIKQYSVTYTNVPASKPRKRWQASCNEHGPRGIHYQRRERACGDCCRKYNNNRYSSEYSLEYREV